MLLISSVCGQVVYNSTDVPVTIPSNAPSVITSTIDISALNECVDDINVIDLDITHSWDNDLVITLTSPGGTTITLVDQICGGEDNFEINFDDSGLAYSVIPCPPTGGGFYHALDALSAFEDEDINGTWTLTVEDVNSWDGGTLNGWGLEITTKPCAVPSGACDEDTPFFAANLTEDSTMLWISPAVRRDGLCCDEEITAPPIVCIEFEVSINSGTMAIEFGIYSGAIPSGSMFFQVDCGDPTPVGDAFCLDGEGPFTITFCKPGNNVNEYYIQSIPAPPPVVNVSAIVNCSVELNATGMQASTVVWNDITSGNGAYNSYLSCTNGCLDPMFFAPEGAPPFVDYEVCGTSDNTLCSNTTLTVCDTVTVTIYQPFNVSVSPNPIEICYGQVNTTPIIASTDFPGEPYDYTWYDGSNATGNIVGDTSFYVPTSPGNYSVYVYNINFGTCSEQIANVLVTETTLPVLNGVPSDVTVDCDNIPSPPNVTATDYNSNSLNVNYSEVEGSGCPYIITRTWATIDNCGNIVSDSQEIVVIDNTPPSLIGVPADVSVDCENIPAIATVTATDDCSNNLIPVYSENVITGCPYVIQRTWTVADECGNITTEVQNVTVDDNEAPVITLTDTAAVNNITAITTDYHVLNNGDKIMGDKANNIDHIWTTISFPEPFENTPVVLSQVTSASGNEAVETRTRNVSTTGFEIKLQEQQSGNNNVSPEEVSWVAIEKASDNANMVMEAGATGYNVRHNWYTINFANTYSNPVFIADLQSYAGSDPTGLRYHNLNTSNVQVVAEEERSSDNEMNHAYEDIGYVVFDAPGDIIDSLGTVIGEQAAINVTQANSNSWTTIFFSRTYTNPVVVAGPVSYNEDDPTTIRVRAITSNSFQIQIDEWDYLTGQHASETIHYMVIEEEGTIYEYIDQDAAACEFTAPPLPLATATDNCSNNLVINFTETTSGTGCDSTITRTWTTTDDCNNVATETQVIVLADTTQPVIVGIPDDITLYCGEDVPAAPDTSCTTIVENVALGKSATQINTAYGGDASRANDGNTSGSWGNGSVTHTNNNSESWWQVDLQAVEDISYINLWNRTDCCSDRLADYYVLVSEDPFVSTDLTTTINQAGVSSFYFAGTAGSPTLVNVNTSGRYVRVQLNKHDYLSLAEVEIFAEKIDNNGICVSDDCDDDVDLNFTEVSTQTNNGTCTDDNYTITRTWTAVDDCGNTSVQTQVITMSCECCDNNIDDDGDGLIDSSDPDCSCSDNSISYSCDPILTYYIPPVWQMNGGQYNGPSSLTITTLHDEANVTVRTGDGVTFNQSFVVNNGSPTSVPLSEEELQTPNYNTVESDRGFIIESDEPIQVLYSVAAYYTKFVVPVKGEEALGRSFRTGSQTKTCGSASTSRRENHFISVIATEDNTTVSFDYTTVMAGGISSPHTVILNAGESYLIRDDNNNTTISGSLVTADKPIAVVSGSQNTNICNSFSADSGIDQLVPTCNVGSEYVLVRGEGTIDQNYAVVVPIENNTEIYINGSIPAAATVNAGSYFEVDITGSYGDAHYISTSKPCYVYQFSGLSTIQPEVDMALVPPLGGCNGNRKLDFPRMDGGEIHGIYVIIEDTNLSSLLFNGLDYTFITSAQTVPGLTGYSVVLFEDWAVDFYNEIEADGNFHAAIVTGITNTSGGFGYTSSFTNKINVFDPRYDLQTTSYFVDSVCVGNTISHCLSIESCSNNNNITNIDVASSMGTVTLTSDLCIDYTAPNNYFGTDEIAVTVENDFGLLQEVCLEFYVCNGGDLQIGSVPDTVTIECTAPVPEPPLPVTGSGCLEIDYTETIIQGTGGCANNTYSLEREWITRGYCGDDSIVFTQIVNVIDNTPPILTNIPADVEIQCDDCLSSFLNGDFEEPGFSGSWVSIHEDDIEGWSTTASDDRIEIQKSGGVDGVASYSGNYHAELNGNLNGDFYQEFCTVPTTTLQISFAHHKRMSGNNSTDDIMAVYAGPDINNLTWLGTFTATSVSGWVVHTVNYAIPDGQTSTVFAFRAIQGAPSNITYGNLIDDINVVTLFETNVVPDAYDNCDSDVELEVSEERIDGLCEDHFQLIRTWTATDNCGNQSTASQILTVGDFEPPVFTVHPPDVTVDCGSIPSPPSDIVSYDSCDVTTNIDIFYNELELIIGDSCNYTITRTWTSADACGNEGTIAQVITVIDNEPPVFSNVPANITVDCDAIPAPVDPTATDNCSPFVSISLTESQPSSSCSGTFTILRTWTATDNCGNQSTAEQYVIVVDNNPPTLSGLPTDITVECGNVPSPANVQVTDDCVANIAVDFVENTVIDGCPGGSIITRTWTATDSCGNTAIASQQIIVLDQTPPVITSMPADVTIGCNDTPIVEYPTATDNCDNNISFSYSDQTVAGNCSNNYTILRTWTATDDCNNQSSEVQTITVEDLTPPLISVFPADTTVNCHEVPAPSLPVYSDLCSGTVTLDFNQVKNTNNCEDNYTIINTWTATDECGNSATAVQTITVVDVIPPVIVNIPNDTIVECSGIPVISNPTTYDNCDNPVNVIYSERVDSVDCSSYTLTRVWTAIDNCGNVTIAEQEITINDNISPVFDSTPSDITVSCGSIPSPEILTASDNCDNNVDINYSEITSPGPCVDQYNIERTWTATDECGNFTTFVQNVNVIDCGPDVQLTVSPNPVVCENENISLNVNLTAGYLTPYYLWQFSDDNGANWFDLPGINSASHSFNVSLAEAGLYRVKVANSPADINDPLCSEISNPVEITVLQNSPETNLVEEICQGESYTLGSNTITTSGNYSYTFSNANGCDSVVNLSLTVHPVYTVNVSETICEGESVAIGTSVYTSSGTYSDLLASENGCDSVVNLSLTVHPVYNVNISETICEGESVAIGTSVYTSSGDYSDLLASENGCDSMVNLSLTVHPVYNVNISETICEGESVTIGTSVYTSSGDYSDLLASENGCDSVVNLSLAVHPVYNVNVSETICDGESVTIGTSVYTTSGTYSDLLTSMNGCDSVVNLDLTVHPVYNVNISETICEGESVAIGTSVYTSSGTYSDLLSSVNGCDSVVNLSLTVHPVYNVNISETICDGESVAIGTSVYTTSGNYSDLLTSENGCDSVVNLSLTVHPVYTVNVSETICDGESVTIGTSVYTTSGNYSDLLTSENGCDSVVNLSLTVHPVYNVNISETICEGESVAIGTSVYTSSGDYSDLLASENGCDSVVNLSLTVHPVYNVNISETICDGESVTVGTSVYTSSGDYSDLLTSENGCDSVVNLSLTVHPVYTVNVSETICDGESVTIGTSVYTTSGNYSDLLTSMNGCDSVVNLDLTVHPVYNVNISETICEGESVTVGTSVYTSSGNYSDLLTSVNGCDSVVNLSLTVHPVYTVNVSETICEGESVTVGTSVYTSSGDYSDLLTSENGCDSVVNLSLTVHPVYTVNVSETICQGESIVIGSNTYTSSGNYTDILTSIHGCDSIVNLNLTVNPAYNVNISEMICEGESVTIGANTYNASGNYTDVLTTVNGCDSTIYLNLVVNPTYAVDVAVQLCEGAEYHGVTYYADDTVTESFQTIFGCDSIVTSYISIVPIIEETVDLELCSGSSYNGQIFTASDTLIENYITAQGCDSIVTVQILVHGEAVTNLVEEICEGESVQVGNGFYTDAGNYTVILNTVNGCDSTVNLDLTVHPVYTETLTEVICEGESVQVGNSVYTTSGNYTDVLTTINGCDSTVNLNLTVHPVYTETITEEICDGENVQVGNSVYTTSGNYTDVLTTINGCDSTINLNLTVHPVYTETITEEICEGESVQVGNNVYTTSGNYTDVLTTVNGCDSVVNLVLTVHPVYTETITENICEGESVQVGNSVYTSSGNYTDVLSTVNGCDSTVILNLTVHPNYTTDLDEMICNGESVQVGNNTYSSTGYYTNLLSSENGCDSVVNLNLIVNPVYTADIIEIICEGESVQVGNNVYTTSGNYTDVLTTINGCDSTVNMSLTVYTLFIPKRLPK